LLIFPGSSFGPQWGDCMRITFLQPEEKLAEAMERMKKTISNIMAQRA
jgi:aspartate/methionine/tyrosine aminotransferase